MPFNIQIKWKTWIKPFPNSHRMGCNLCPLAFIMNLKEMDLSWLQNVSRETVEKWHSRSRWQRFQVPWRSCSGILKSYLTSPFRGLDRNWKCDILNLFLQKDCLKAFLVYRYILVLASYPNRTLQHGTSQTMTQNIKASCFRRHALLQKVIDADATIARLGKKRIWWLVDVGIAFQKGFDAW